MIDNLAYRTTSKWRSTVNDREFLCDKTGNRRFLPFPVTSLNHQHNIDMQQLWAQVLDMHKRKLKRFPSSDEETFLKQFTQSFEPIDPIEELIRENFDFEGNPNLESDKPTTKATATEICKIIDVPIERKNTLTISQICRKLTGKEAKRGAGGRREFHMPSLTKHSHDSFIPVTQVTNSDQVNSVSVTR